MKVSIKKVLVVGGAGYVGAVLIPKLIKAGYFVRVFDLYIFSRSRKLGADIFGDFINNPKFQQIKGDVRDRDAINLAVKGMDAVIHLACLSNDPSVEIDRSLGKSINYLSFFPFLNAVNEHKVKRLIFASTPSVYGVKTEDEVTESLPLEPLTDYGLYKVFCEKAITDIIDNKVTDWVIIRPSTVCGYSPRMRLDLSVNILTNLAINKGVINVFGGKQQRPNIHIEDVADLYLKMLKYPSSRISGEIFNAGNENLSILQIAQKVKKIVGRDVKIVVEDSSDDNRSYRVSWKKINKNLGWRPKHSIEDAIRDLVLAFKKGNIPNSLSDNIYYNVKRIREIGLK